MDITTTILGFLFGAILIYSRLNKFDTISGAARQTDFAVPKAIAVAIGLGMIFLTVEIGLGLADYHVKPFLLGGIILGGLIFGAGMAILGYCPGTLFVSVGEGSVDALIGIVGGLAGGVVYTVTLPYIGSVLGPDLGKISLQSIVGGQGVLFYTLVSVIGVAFIAGALWLNRKEGTKDHKWLYSGIALSVLNPIVFLTSVSGRPIGASTPPPSVPDWLTGLTGGEYFNKIKTPGNWELIFLFGAMLAGLIFSLIRKNFKLTLIHQSWEEFKGKSVSGRVIWAFIGGFILVFGARMAGGCTSGHILSGGMQVAVSSLVFAVFVFIGLLITGKLFYKKGKELA
jgi:uncharacterized membrane protein YedE/YeeE